MNQLCPRHAALLEHSHGFAGCSGCANHHVVVPTPQPHAHVCDGCRAPTPQPRLAYDSVCPSHRALMPPQQQQTESHRALMPPQQQQTVQDAPRDFAPAGSAVCASCDMPESTPQRVEQRPTLDVQDGHSFTLNKVDNVDHLDIKYHPEVEFSLMRNTADPQQFRCLAKPTEEHTVYVDYKGHPVAGSPFQIKPRAPAVKPSVTMQPGKSFLINGVPDRSHLNITGDNGVAYDLYANSAKEGQYRCDFHPAANGVHNFAVTVRGEHVEGSPFQVQPKAMLPPPEMHMDATNKLVTFKHVPEAAKNLKLETGVGYKMYEDKMDPNMAHVVFEPNDEVHHVRATYLDKEIDGANFYLAPKHMQKELEAAQAAEDEAERQKSEWERVAQVNSSMKNLAVTTPANEQQPLQQSPLQNAPPIHQHRVTEQGHTSINDLTESAPEVCAHKCAHHQVPPTTGKVQQRVTQQHAHVPVQASKPVEAQVNANGPQRLQAAQPSGNVVYSHRPAQAQAQPAELVHRGNVVIEHEPMPQSQPQPLQEAPVATAQYPPQQPRYAYPPPQSVAQPQVQQPQQTAQKTYSAPAQSDDTHPMYGEPVLRHRPHVVQPQYMAQNNVPRYY